MTPIEAPEFNLRGPDALLAQTVAADSGWQTDDKGRVYAGRRLVGASLEALAKPMRDAGWFVPADAEAQGVHWSNLPPVEKRAAVLRGAGGKA